jgi:hypothetical protein
MYTVHAEIKFGPEVITGAHVFAKDISRQLNGFTTDGTKIL